MKNHSLRILVTSIGSLVGQNILDVLEFPDFRRKEDVYLVGTNTIISPNNFRCDKCYTVPNTATSEFTQRMIEIIQTEEPDLILSGRDEDTEVMVRLMKNNPQLKGKTPYGELKTVIYALDKWETWLFTQKHGLPFANTFVSGKAGGFSELESFVEEVGYPLIAKPVQGFASKGVFFVRNWDQAQYLASLKNYMFQEYLGEPDAMNRYFETMDGPTPLFAHAPNVFHHSCHTVISPTGDMDKVFISRNDHESGVTIGFRRVQNEELEALTISYAKALFSEGGFGPLTVQFKEDRHGAWKAQEMNLRTNGNTYPRFLMGQDDLGLIVKGVLPEADFPVYHAPQEASAYIIGKLLHSHIMLPKDLEVFQTSGVWKAE